MTEPPSKPPPEPSPPAPPEQVVVIKRQGNLFTQGMRFGATGCVGCLTFIVLAFLLLIAIGSCVASGDDESRRDVQAALASS